MFKSQSERKLGKGAILFMKGNPSDFCPQLPVGGVRSGLGSRGWKECWLWKGGPSRRLRSGEGLQRTAGTPGSSSLTSLLCCNTGFRATATGGMVHILFSPFSDSGGPGLEGLAEGTWPRERQKEESKPSVIRDETWYQHLNKVINYFLKRRLSNIYSPSIKV